MSYYIGIDGGGTKTAFAIGKADGEIIKTVTLTGCSYSAIGINGVKQIITSGIEQLLNGLDISLNDCKGICVGLPLFSENKVMDEKIVNCLSDAFKPCSVQVVNDGVVGMVGSLCGEPGIHLVAGTGSIAFGLDNDGNIDRTGGWCEFFSDEGSCYWLGKKTIELFSKQADGREKRSALYDLIAKDFNISEPFDIIDIILKDYAPYREKVAALQLYAEKAAKLGDESAAELYKEAAKELALIVVGLKNKLNFKGKVTVSYFGGLFKAGELILAPLKQLLDKENCVLTPPKYTAVKGALLLSIKTFNKGE